MKKAFITVRFDRMQNIYLKVLCQQIISEVEKYNSEQFQLDVIVKRFKQTEPLLKNLSQKYRKMPQTATIETLRKRQEVVVSSMLQHLKAVKRVEFDDQKTDVNNCFHIILKHFKNFVHEGMRARNGIINSLQLHLKSNSNLGNAIQALGLYRYIDAILDLKLQMNSKKLERTNLKLQQPRPGVTLPSKAEIISELRFMLQSIDVIAATHPENDYRQLISSINQYLTEARAQLRNLASRRKTAKAKEEKKKDTDQPENL